MEAIRRVNRSREQAKISYDKLSKWYDFFGNMERKFRDTGLEKLGVREGEKVLEVGFGTGYCTANLAGAVGDSGKVYGIDISEGMLNTTSLRLAKSGLSKRVELQCGDALNLPYLENFFDAVYISFALELFDTPDIPVVLQQFRRVLKNGGTYLRRCDVQGGKDWINGKVV
jgi:demethylmenaquinone methyltransferase/2-methoxy-6-polyprenyl-1,4-benzoquinol methylase